MPLHLDRRIDVDVSSLPETNVEVQGASVLQIRGVVEMIGPQCFLMVFVSCLMTNLVADLCCAGTKYDVSEHLGQHQMFREDAVIGPYRGSLFAPTAGAQDLGTLKAPAATHETGEKRRLASMAEEIVEHGCQPFFIFNMNQ